MELLCCNIATAQDFDWVQFWSNMGVALIGVLAILFAYLQYRHGQSNEKRKEQRQDIHKKLNEFYGPFLQLRKKSDILYDRFQKIHREKDPKFSTLRSLMKGEVFEGNDNVILNEIIKIGGKCEDLIHSKAGLIDDSNLREVILPKLTTHFLILRMAYEGKFDNEIQRFDDLTFPIEVDSLIEKRFKELEKELKELNK